MSVINVEHISKLYGDKMILEDLSCSVDEGDKMRKAAKDLFDAMELLPGRVKMERDVHYIDDKTAAMNLHLVLMMAALEDGLWQ